MTRSSVDLPEPEGPSRAVSDPPGTSRLTSSRATKSPKRLLTSETVMATATSLSVEDVHEENREEGDEREHHRRA